MKATTNKDAVDEGTKIISGVEPFFVITSALRSAAGIHRINPLKTKHRLL
jgi:hypothetical protein